MSLKKWKEKFYPIPAEETPKEKAIEHSLNKWKGLRVLEEFDLKKDGRCIIENNEEDLLMIDATSCALCYWYTNENDFKISCCETCPLYLIREIACDEQLDSGGKSNNDESPYQIWKIDEDPEPMITLLGEVLRRQNEL